MQSLHSCVSPPGPTSEILCPAVILSSLGWVQNSQLPFPDKSATWLQWTWSLGLFSMKIFMNSHMHQKRRETGSHIQNYSSHEICIRRKTAPEVKYKESKYFRMMFKTQQ
ncbi:uncharacterized protein ACOB8E_007999 isoform 1-T4 [Sarcophilus harrisii]